LLKVGVIGCGYWGPNLIRNFTQIQGSEVLMCADLSEDRLKHMKGLYPHLEVTGDYKNVLANETINAVVIATPPETHHALSMEALNAGKHVFAEKPLAANGAQSSEMVARASELGLTLMTGHTFVYTAAVNKIKDIIASGELGDIYYIHSTRVNLGLFQQNINVVWDLAPHDVSIMNYILDSRPEQVSAVGHSYIQKDVEDVAFLTLRYPHGVMAHVHVSWLNPNKIRRTTVVGSKKMLVYDDISAQEKIRVYDKGVSMPKYYDTFGEFHLSYRFGDIFIPKLDDAEPLKVECQHFIDCVEGRVQSRSSGKHGHEVVTVLETAVDSIRQNGRMLDVTSLESAR
jgi:predicted dehydrogenase